METYVSLETAQLLKQLGFNLETYTWYSDRYFREDHTRPNIVWNTYKNTHENYSAPSVNVAQRWLRETKNIEVQVEWYVVINGIINPFEKRQYEYSIQGPIDMPHMCYSENGFKTYEDALETGINKCLKLLLKDD